MMKKNNNNKIIFFVLLFMSIGITIYPEKAYASSFGAEVANGGGMSDGNNDGSSYSPNEKGHSLGLKQSCDEVSCGTTHSYKSSVEVNVDIKLMDGTIINDDIFSANFSTKFLAGTYVMLRVYENQTHMSTGGYSFSAKRKYLTCKHYKREFKGNVCSSKMVNGICTGNWVPDFDYVYVTTTTDHECVCPVYYAKVEVESEEWRDVSSDYADDCRQKAVAQNVKLSPMYDAIYKDSNDIDATKNTGTYITIEGQECSNGKDVEKEDDKYIEEDDKYSNSYQLESKCENINYDRQSTICMNVKNGKVRYLDGGGECDKTLEYEVTKDKDGYWKYFIPLNANSEDGFSFELVSSGYKKSKEICEAIIDNYPDTYPYIITDNPSDTFIGKNLSIEGAKLAVANGCYFKTIVKLPIEQRFYNEVYDDNTFKGFRGFNFYYKPIEINTPFPNGLSDTSLWYDWNESDVKNPNLTESYNTTTYIADTSNHANEIRNYKKTKTYTTIGEKYNTYTSWYNMNINGLSNFIGTLDNENIVYRRDGFIKDNIYPLGCGPWNVNPKKEDGITDNVFYQPECGKK